MSDWWYLQNGKKRGPVSAEKIQRLRAEGRIHGRTRVWQDGETHARPLDDVSELLAQAIKSEPPSELRTEDRSAAVRPAAPHVILDAPSEEVSTAHSASSAWRRFWARTLDMMIFAALFNGVLVLAVLSSPRAAEMPRLPILASCLVMLILLLADALCLAIFGNTPGKALLRIQVRDSDGQPLPLNLCVDRAVKLWIQGCGLGIPLIALATYLWQLNRLTKGQPASYDETRGFQVQLRPLGTWRTLVAALSFVVVPAIYGAFIVAVVSQLPPESNFDLIAELKQQPQSWRNPSTGRSTLLDSRWEIKSLDRDSAEPTFVFTNVYGPTQVELRRVRGAGRSLAEFTKSLCTQSADSFEFRDGGQLVNRWGVELWQVQANVRDQARQPVQFQVLKRGPVFWQFTTRWASRRVEAEPRYYKLEQDLLHTLK